MDGEEQQRKASARLAESLGWLAESAIQPRKRNTIEGVSGGTLVDLKAQLYRTQEESKLRKETGEENGYSQAKKRLKGVDPDIKNRNAGVEERDKMDKLSIKSEADKVDECYAALEKKAELYNKMMGGEISDEEEQYEVNFFHKKYMQQDSPSVPNRSTVEEPTEPSVVAQGDKQEEYERQQRKEMILEQAELTKEGRERAARIKLRRESQAQRKREKLKAAFLKKQLDKLRKAAKDKSVDGVGAQS